MTKSFTKRLNSAIAVVVAVAMLVGALPADMLGGIASVKAAEAMVLNFSDEAVQTQLSGETFAVGSTVTVGDFTLNPSSKAMGYEDKSDSPKSIDGFTFTHRFKLNGTGSYTAQNVSFKTTGAANVLVYAMSGSSGTSRALELADAQGNVVGSVSDDGTAIAKKEYAVDGAGTYYLYSASSGINIYYIAVTPVSGSSAGDVTNGNASEDGSDVTEGDVITESKVTVKVYDDGTTDGSDGSFDGSDKVIVFTAGNDVVEAKHNEEVKLSVSKEYALSVKDCEDTHKATVNGEETFTPEAVAEQDVTVMVEELVPVVALPVADLSDKIVYSKNITVQLSSETEGAEIYYTLDGTEPTTASTKYTEGGIALTGVSNEEVVTTIKAIAVKEGMTDSEVATFKYTISLPILVKKKAAVDLSEGLKAGVVYGDEEVVKITVLADMDVKPQSEDVVVEGTTYSAFIQGSANPSPNKGALSTSGAVFEFEAIADTEMTLVLKSATKTYHFLDITDPKNVIELETGTSVETGSKKLVLEAGKKYQYYLDGSKACVYAMSYSYWGPSDYRKLNIDLSAGLLATEVYGDPEIVELTVLTDFEVKPQSVDAVVEGTAYSAFVQGGSNPSPNKGALSESGAVLVMDAKADCTVTLVLKSATKTYHFLDITDPKNVVELETGSSVETGSKKFILEAGKKYQYYLDGSKACIYAMTVEAGTKPRAEWETVAAPVINEVYVNENYEIIVPFTMLIGDDGADSVTVTMYDANGEVVDSQISKKEGATGEVIFAPEASGTYTFKIAASRDSETTVIEGAEAATWNYVLPLETPYIKNYTNLGEGKVQIGWEATPEAESYLISYKLAEDGATESDQIAVTADMDERADKDWAYTLKNLEVGKKYVVYVQAVRGTEKSANKGSVEITVKDEVEDTWSFTVYGASTSVKKENCTDPEKSANGYSGNANDGSVQVWSTGGKGKIVPASTDGLAFYYTELDPIYDNFVLKATAHVDSWTISNGQDGFGLMVADRVGEIGDTTDPFWNNSYMAAVTKIEYRWNKEAGELTTDSEVAANTSMKLGIGTIARTGVPAGWEASTLPDGFTSTMTTLEYSCGKKYGSGTFNIIGNCTNEDALVGNQTDLIVDIDFTLIRDNTGYTIIYTDKDGNTETKTYYDEKYFDEDGKYTGTYDAPGALGTLAQMDKDNMYLGFFAARNATVTFNNIELTVTDATKDAPAEERVRSLVDPSYSIASASNASSEDYDLQFYSNVPGYVTIQAADGTYVANNVRIAAEDTKLHFPVTLKYGKNSFTWTMVPDQDYEIGGEGSNVFLKDYNTRSEVFTVTYNTFGNKYIYVTPEATAKGKGTAENPVDIATAVKYVGPGQTILLAGGTYNLTSSLTISRGISGTAEEPIRMIMDPESNERPVIDFGKSYKAGMKLAGDYWILQNFDVTNSGDGTDGLQISGNYNLIDSVNTYNNGNTGIQISRLSGTDTTQAEWPSYNTVKNCTSYLNADGGYEDADGFAAKLTVGPGNVFDGCIAAYNADDGWDLFAKVETGPIGVVTIQNCIAYYNGYVMDEDGNRVNAGNGNGFKLGGSSISGYHKLVNSIAFGNKAKGIDSNSCPDIQVENCITFNNESYNVAFYTGSGVVNTDYSATGVISYRTDVLDMKEQIQGKGTQDNAKIYNATNFYWDETAKVSKNTADVPVQVADDWFVSLEAPAFGTIVGRTASGTIDLGDFLKLTDKAVAGVGARDLDTNGEASDYIDQDTLKEEKKELANQGLQVSAIADQVYTGKAIRPALRVSDGVAILTSKDYTVRYKNNLNVGTATVTITGKGNYKGTVTRTFNIVPKSIEGADVTLKNQQIAEVANGSAKTPKVVVKWGKKTLSAKKDYTLSYYTQEDYDANYAAGTAKALTSVTAAGKYVIVIKAKGNYTGEKTASYVLTDKNHVLTKAKIKAIPRQYATGKAVEIENLTVTLGSKTLTKDVDYTVSYLNNVVPGRATVIVTGMGEYAGEKQATFTIVGTPINRATVTGLATTLTYNGEAVTQEGLTLTYKGTKLVSGTDYTVSYKNNGRAGSAQIIFTGTGMYSGTLKKSFRIIAHDIADEYVEGVAGTADGEDAVNSGHIIVEGLETTYVKGGAKLEDLKVKYYDDESKKTFYLTAGKDYTVTYKNNNKIATEITKAKTSPYIVIRGKGAYRGTLTKYFIINPQQLDASRVVNRVEQSVTITASDVLKSTKKNGWMSKIIVTDMNGKRLIGTGKYADYVVKYTYETGGKAGEEVGATDTVPAGTEIRVTITGGPSGYYVGENYAIYKVLDKANNVKRASARQVSEIAYTGDPITLDDCASALNVTLSGKTLVYGVDYEAVPGTYVNNTRRGTARVTIRGIGEYGGQKVISFKITAKDINSNTSNGTDTGTGDGPDVGTHPGTDAGADVK